MRLNYNIVVIILFFANLKFTHNESLRCGNLVAPVSLPASAKKETDRHNVGDSKGLQSIILPTLEQLSSRRKNNSEDLELISGTLFPDSNTLLEQNNETISVLTSTENTVNQEQEGSNKTDFKTTFIEENALEEKDNTNTKEKSREYPNKLYPTKLTCSTDPLTLPTGENEESTTLKSPLEQEGLLTEDKIITKPTDSEVAEDYLDSLFDTPESELTKSNSTDPVPKPLLVTQLLESERIQEAQNMSLTRIGNLTSYTGFFTVDKGCGNHLFFWFVPSSERDWKEAPVILWLNGGPGATSMFGLFMEVGPWKIVNQQLVKNENTWTREHNVVFIDQPAGTGFSFTEKGCYAKNISKVSSEMYSALIQFFTMFPTLQKNKFFMCGESHAGHYLPALAMEIHNRNPEGELRINLVGIMVGNPLIDIRCVHTADFMYELGIIDSRERNEMKDPLLEFDIAIKSNDSTKALMLYLDIIGIKLIDRVGIPSVFNIIYDHEISFEFENYFARQDVRREIHVGSTPFNLLSKTVTVNLWPDRYTSQAPDIEYLLRTGNYTVGFYVGQLDARIPYSSLPCVLKKLHWSGAADYHDAKRFRWYVSGRLAGWAKVVGNLYEVVVRKSGHMVPMDYGEASLELIKAVVANNPGDTLLAALEMH